MPTDVALRTIQRENYGYSRAWSCRFIPPFSPLPASDARTATSATTTVAQTAAVGLIQSVPRAMMPLAQPILLGGFPGLSNTGRGSRSIGRKFGTLSLVLILAIAGTVLSACGGNASKNSVPSANVSSQSISFTAPPSSVTYGASAITLSATATSGLPVTFSVLSGPGVLSGTSGSVLTITGAGTVVVAANQPGNSSYAAAAEATHAITVQPAVLDVVADNQNMTQGGTLPSLTFHDSGFVNGDTMESAVTGGVILSTTATSTSPAGEYPIVVTPAGLISGKYSFRFDNGSLAITIGKPQSISFANPGQGLSSVPYGVAPVVLSATATSGLPVVFSVLSGPGVVSGTNGSTLTITAPGTVVVAANQSGNSTYVAAPQTTRTITVQKAVLDLAVDNKVMIQGATLPNLTFHYSGFVDGDTMKSAVTGWPALSTTATSASPEGAYPITISANGLASEKYSFRFDNGTLAISGRPQSISFANPGQVLAGTTDALQVSSSSGLPVTLTSLTPGTCSVSGMVATFSMPGTCSIQATQPGNSVYSAAAPVTNSFDLVNSMPVITNMAPGFVIIGSGDQNLTITGTGFLPSTSVSFAGSPHPATYISRTKMVVPLTAADQATFGAFPITLTNASSGGGAATSNLPVLILPNGLLDRSQLAAGNQSRLQRLIEKGRNGQPVTVVAIGGSITQGGGASDWTHDYEYQFRTLWQEMFPSSPITVINQGISGTQSDFGALRAKRDVLSTDPDLVIVEFAVNDKAAGVGRYGATYEGLVRQLIDSPDQPAVILLFMMSYTLPIDATMNSAEPWQKLIGANYDLPMVSYADAIGPEIENGDISLALITHDVAHPSDIGHAYTALFLQTALENAMANFPPGTPVQGDIATAAPLYSDVFEYTTLQDGIGNRGPALQPTGNSGWIPEAKSSDATLGPVPEGLQSSTPGSTLDFTVNGQDILVGFYLFAGPMGQATVSVDGVAYPKILNGWSSSAPSGTRGEAPVATGLAPGTHQVHIELLDTKDPNSTGTIFRVLSIGTGGAQ